MNIKEHKIYFAFVTEEQIWGFPPKLLLVIISLFAIMVALVPRFIDFNLVKLFILVCITLSLITGFIFYVKTLLSKDPKYFHILGERLKYDRNFMFKKVIKYEI